MPVCIVLIKKLRQNKFCQGPKRFDDMKCLMGIFILIKSINNGMGLGT